MARHPAHNSVDQAMRGRIGGLVTAATHDTRALTAPARAAFRSKFERDVDPDGVLPNAERLRRAEAARKAHFTQLAYRSAQARRGRKKGAAA